MKNLLLWFKLKLLERQTLLVCAGSGRGRSPFAIVNRKDAVHHEQLGVVLMFSSYRSDFTWKFKITAETELIADEISERLRKKKVYSIFADNRIRSVVVYRSDIGSQPYWIGGDAASCDVDLTRYGRTGNNAYVLKPA